MPALTPKDDIVPDGAIDCEGPICGGQPPLSAPYRAGPILPAMTPDAQTALDSAVRYAYALLRQVRGALAPMMRRADRTAARQALRLAEQFLRRALLLLSFTLDETLGPQRPARRTTEPRSNAVAIAQRGLRLTEPPALLRIRTLRPLPAGLFDHLDPDELLPGDPFATRLARIEAALARLPAKARRLALWRRRMRGTRRHPLRPRLILPRPKDVETRHLMLWLSWIDRTARDGLHPAPG